VLVISLVLAALWRLVRHPDTRRLDDILPRRYPSGVAAVAWLVIVGWILVGGELLALPAAAFAPPLFVSVLEWLDRGRLSAGDAMRRCGLLVGAALFGSATVRVLPIGVVAGVVAVCATLALMRVLAVAHPPALAIALIPHILPAAAPPTYVAAITTGAAALYVGAFFAALATPRTLRAQLVGGHP
jgi:hypothetical protein